jgi:phospholipase C
VPDVRNHRELAKDYGQMGFRIPAVCVSPWVRRAHVAHQTYGFESILKLIQYRFGLPPLTVRDAYARNIGRSFDFESKPRLEIPDLPHPALVVSAPCQNEASLTHLASAPGTHEAAAATTRPRPKHHDLMDLVYSGYLERLGFHFQYATPESTFREPDKVRSAHAASTAPARP